MSRGDRGVDFVNIDGGEGGTGAAPMIFADSVALPVPDRVRRGLPPLRRGRPDRRRHLHRRRQARPARQRRRRLRARRRHGQRRPRGDDGDRLHPGAEVPHRPLPHRRRHPEPVANRGLDPTLKSVRARQLRQDAAARPAQGLRGGRRRAPRPDHRRRRRHHRRHSRSARRARPRSTATTPAGAAAGRRGWSREIDGDHGGAGRQPHGRDASAPRPDRLSVDARRAAPVLSWWLGQPRRARRGSRGPRGDVVLATVLRIARIRRVGLLRRRRA